MSDFCEQFIEDMRQDFRALDEALFAIGTRLAILEDRLDMRDIRTKEVLRSAVRKALSPEETPGAAQADEA